MLVPAVYDRIYTMMYGVFDPGLKGVIALLFDAVGVFGCLLLGSQLSRLGRLGRIATITAMAGFAIASVTRYF